jgi:DNA-binding NarL/FixJ family response regulator
MKRIAVLLAADHIIVRQGFRRMLELEGDFEIVGEASNGRAAVALVKKFHPEVVLMDIAMPLLNGLEATRQVLRAVPSTKIILLSAHNDDAYIKNATDLGVRGFLLKQNSSHEVCCAIREVHQGKTFFRPPFGASVFSPRDLVRVGLADYERVFGQPCKKSGLKPTRFIPLTK